jgi:hypothetical protein
MGEIMKEKNKERVYRASRAMTEYEVEGSLVENVVDLVTDLRHLCEMQNISFDNVILLSEIHYEVEK